MTNREKKRKPYGYHRVVKDLQNTGWWLREFGQGQDKVSITRDNLFSAGRLMAEAEHLAREIAGDVP